MNTINGNFLERTIPSLKGALVTLNMGNSTSEMNLEDLATNLGAGVTSIIPGSGISVDQSTGNVTISATGGGGGTNPTSTYVPFNNGGTFADSYLINDAANSVLKTVYEGNDIGLKIDFANGYGQLYSNTGSGLFYDGLNSIIGDYTFKNNGTYFSVDDYSTIIQSRYQNTDKGLLIDFLNQQYVLGNPEGGSWGNANNSDGLMMNLSGEIISLGYNFSGGVTLYMDNSNETIRTYMGGSNTGLSLDFLNKLYSFGQLNGGNSTKLEIDDNNQKLILSSNLETASGGDAAEKWLKVTIGTTDYLIALLNPPV